MILSDEIRQTHGEYHVISISIHYLLLLHHLN